MSIESFATSIYHIYHPTTRKLILLACGGIAILTPFTDTVYLPALASVADDFDTNTTMVSLTVSIYLATVGIGQLIWGPLSDYYGRNIVLYLTLVVFEAFTIGCIFVTSIEQLIGLRAVEGLVVGSTLISAQAIITDVFAPDERGTAMSAFLAPMLIGPVIAPIIGGVLAQSFGWRSTFVLLAVITIPILVISYFTVPETHQYFVLQQIEECNSKKYQNFQQTQQQTLSEDPEQQPAQTQAKPTNESSEPPVITNSYDANIAREVSSKYHTNIVHIHERHVVEAPIFVAPWTTLLYLFDPTLAPYYAVHFMGFGIMFTSLTLISLKLVESPYNLSETQVGITFIAIGVGMLIGSVLGGATSDMAAAKYPQVIEGRMVYSIIGMVFEIMGAIGFGFAVDYGAHLAIVLVTHFILGIGQSMLMSCCLGYFPAVKPLNAGGVSSVSLCMCFVVAAIFVTIADTVSNAIGFANFFVLLTGVFFFICLWCSYEIFSKVWPYLLVPSNDTDDNHGRNNKEHELVPIHEEEGGESEREEHDTVAAQSKTNIVTM